MKRGCKCVLGEGKGYVEGSLQPAWPWEPENQGYSMRVWDVYLPMGNLEGGMDSEARTLEPHSPKFLPP